MSEANAENGATGAPDLGGLQIPPIAGAQPDTTVPGGSASAEVVAGRKRRSDAGRPRGSRGATASGGIPSLSQTQFAALYNPEVWSKALAAPADAMAAITGKKHWEVSEKEREALGATGSIAAQCFAVIDPRWLAVSLALITVLDVYGVRLAIDYSERKKKREAEDKNKRGT